MPSVKTLLSAYLGLLAVAVYAAPTEPTMPPPPSTTTTTNTATSSSRYYHLIPNATPTGDSSKPACLDVNSTMPCAGGFNGQIDNNWAIIQHSGAPTSCSSLSGIGTLLTLLVVSWLAM